MTARPSPDGTAALFLLIGTVIAAALTALVAAGIEQFIGELFTRGVS